MSPVKVNRVDNNLEVLTKIANSVARKYGCSVKFNPDTMEADFTGPASCKSLIEEEIKDIFLKKE